MSEPDDDGFEDPLTNREIDAALAPFTTRKERRWVIKLLEDAGLVVLPDD